MIIGVTGNIGAGKSTFTKIFSVVSNIPAFDGDFISKCILATHEKAVNEICERHGKNADHHYEDFLKENFFQYTELQKEIEAFVSPLFWKYVKDLEETHGNIILESAIIFEKKDQDKIDVIIGIQADFTTRLKRLIARGMTRENAVSRIKHQLNFYHYEAECDYIVHNDVSTSADLVRQANTFLLTLYDV